MRICTQINSLEVDFGTLLHSPVGHCESRVSAWHPQQGLILKKVDFVLPVFKLAM